MNGSVPSKVEPQPGSDAQLESHEKRLVNKK